VKERFDMDVNDLRIAVTVLSLLAFLGLLGWVLQARHRAAVEEAARLPLDDERDDRTSP
jgi:cbb3-type cytochrome oxidase subunit 3